MSSSFGGVHITIFLLFSPTLSGFHSLLDYCHQHINMPLDPTSPTTDSFICLCMTDVEVEGYLFSQIPLLPFSVKPIPSNFHKHLLTKTILIMIPSHLHSAIPTCQFPICFTLAPPAALDYSVYLPGLHTLSTC